LLGALVEILGAALLNSDFDVLGFFEVLRDFANGANHCDAAVKQQFGDFGMSGGGDQGQEEYAQAEK